MSWLNHPSFEAAFCEILPRLKSEAFSFRKLKPIVFLCGAANSSPRDTLHQYLKTQFRDLLLFYADEVWDLISAQLDHNALWMENLLADLSDLVIIIVESPGTFAELGAFSFFLPLRKKLLPIVDARYIDASSFLSTGPLRWVDEDSKFRPTIFAPLDAILRSADEIDERLARVPRFDSERIEKVHSSSKHLLFLVCDLVRIFGPVTAEDVVVLLGRLLEQNVELPRTRTLLGVSKAMGLLDSTVHQAQSYYLPYSTTHGAAAHIKKKFLHLPEQRAIVLSVIQKISEARTVLYSTSAHDVPSLPPGRAERA